MFTMYYVQQCHNQFKDNQYKTSNALE